MTGDRNVSVEISDERRPRATLLLLRQLLAQLDRNRPRLCERLQRLDAPQRRTGQDAVELVPGEQADELLGLAATAVVERPQAVVPVPFVALASTRVANEEN